MLMPPIVGAAVFLACLSAHAGRLILEEEPAAAAPAQAAPSTRAATDHVGPILAPNPPPSPAAPSLEIGPVTVGVGPASELQALRLLPGQRLSAALGLWLKDRGIELSWEAAGSLPGRVRDVLIESSWLASQRELEPTLAEVLAPFGLVAHLLRLNRSSTEPVNTVVVRNIDGSTNPNRGSAN